MKKLLQLTAAAVFAVTFNANADDGSAIFTKECAKCHGADGKGDTAMGKKLKIKDLTVVAAKLGEAKIETSIKEGTKDGDKVRMKAFKDLSEADVKAVAKYVLKLK